MKTKNLLIAFFSLVLLSFFVIQYGCKKDDKPDPEPQPTDELILSEDVVEIDTIQMGSPVIEGDNYTFTDNGNLPQFEVGDIIVGNSGYGYMRKVTSISTQGDDIVLTTSQATLEEVIENCNIKDSIKLTLDKAIYKGQEYPAMVVFLAEGAKISEKGGINLSGFQIFSGTYGGVDVTAQIDQGSINFEPVFTREIEIRWFKLKHLRLLSGGNLDFTCDASVVVDGPVVLDKERLVAQIYFGPFPFVPVPVFIVLSFNAGISANLDITGSIGSGFDTEAYLEYGADYTDSQWSTIWEKSFESNSHGVTWDLSGETDSKVYVSPEVGLLVAGVAGPYMEAVPYLGFDGNINSGNQTWNWDLAAGAEGNIGFIVQIFGHTIANYSTTLANWEAIIAQDNGVIGSNNPPTAIFAVDPTTGTTSTVFEFDASSSYDNEDPTSALQVRWDWENNGSWDTYWSTDKTENHQYSNEGTYTVKMEVKDTEGATDQTTKNVYVTGGSNTPPTAIFTVDPSSGTTSTVFEFDASGSSDNEDPTSDLQVRWDWENDGSWDTGWDYDKTENHQYGTEGTYTVKMEVKDTEGATDQTTKNVYVTGGSNTPPTAVFTVDPSSGTTSTIFEFDGSGSYDNEDPTSDLQVRWDFDGDGSWDTGWDYDKTENHQYSSEDTYTVKMEVKDTEGLTDYTTNQVLVENPSPCDGITQFEYGGQIYHTVEIGTQCWMKENINYETGNSWCYDNDPSNCETYGRLYNRNTALIVCPSGWHLPDKDEWDVLVEHLGGNNIAGGEMKEVGYSHWKQPNTGATNSSNFTALPGGHGYSDYPPFTGITKFALFWSYSTYGPNGGWARILSYNDKEIERDHKHKDHRCSVRCIKD